MSGIKAVLRRPTRLVSSPAGSQVEALGLIVLLAILWLERYLRDDATPQVFVQDHVNESRVIWVLLRHSNSAIIEPFEK